MENQLLSPELKKAFEQIASELSPENLMCDGEISYSAAMKKKRVLDKMWKDLEAKAGRKVDESELYSPIPMSQEQFDFYSK